MLYFLTYLICVLRHSTCVLRLPPCVRRQFDTYLAFNVAGSHSRLTTADGARTDASGLLVALEYLADAAVRDAQRPADDARTRTLRRHLYDLQPDVVRQRATIDEDAAQLVDPALACHVTQNNKIRKSYFKVAVCIFFTRTL